VGAWHLEVEWPTEARPLRGLGAPMGLPNESTTPEEDIPPSSAPDAKHGILTLCVLWCPEEPWRLGEVALLPTEVPGVIGRGDTPIDGPGLRVRFGRVTPGGLEIGLPIGISQISRTQAVVTATLPGDVLDVRNVGRTRLFLNGNETTEASLHEGDVIQFGRQMLLICIRRSMTTISVDPAYPRHSFGSADAQGLVGESPVMNCVRRAIAFAAPRDEHVLIRGASGTGKELIAQALHRLSRRSIRPIVSRNAATIPVALVDAELFGNAKNYPNATMPERPGLIGEADGSTLFLDEFAELPHEAQSHLLRALDDGEYHRLGETVSRRSNFRLVAATNRDESAIKEDVLGRFAFRIDVPDFTQRREDVPLLIVHLLRSFAVDDAALADRFFGGDPRRFPNVSFDLVRALVSRPYRTNVRELKALLWSAIQGSAGDEIKAGRGSEMLERRPDPESFESGERAVTVAEPGITPQKIRDALDRNNGELEATWRELGLKNRYALRRLLARHGIEVRKRM